MPRTVPTPLAAAIGLVPAAFEGALGLPGKVVQAPLVALSSALSTLDSTRRGYEDLADRGERLVARLRGTSFDEVEDAVEERLQGTPVAGAYDTVEDAVEDAVEGANRALRSVTGGVGKAASKAVENAGQAAQQTAAQLADDVEAASAVASAAGSAVELDDVPGAAATPAVLDDEAPKGVATPRATEPASPRVDSAAHAEAQETADDVTAASGALLDHDELPLQDYDHMTLGSLRGRLRTLTVEQLGQVRAYEKAHADRLPVVTMLDNRIARLVSDAGVTPSGGTVAPPVPELRPSQIARGGSKVTPATAGPAKPPTQGDPRPAQPR